MMATTVDFNREKRLLRGVLSEALEAQDRKRFALEQQAESAQSLDIDADDKARAKALRCAAAIPIQLLLLRWQQNQISFQILARM